MDGPLIVLGKEGEPADDMVFALDAAAPTAIRPDPGDPGRLLGPFFPSRTIILGKGRRAPRSCPSSR
ncbi:hypothetical protein AB0J83_41735 [Actinoplanes sp. NPDC049596]|uniref:hypothetical protein n=1 Tax=Actinoplanes sp. NPDC049596 TaxID=3154625 RepID=UPI00342802BA